jgi:hypothetical protein
MVCGANTVVVVVNFVVQLERTHRLRNIKVCLTLLTQ